MNLRQITYKLGAALCILALFSSCGEDRSDELKELTEVQHWIYDTMDQWYYWNDELPSKDNVKFTDKPEPFFQSLLSDKDGTGDRHFSYIEKDKHAETRSVVNPDDSYGISFVVLPTRPIVIYIQYIVPNSPADKANLKRGDLIHTINDAPISDSNYKELIQGPGIEKVAYTRFNQQGFKSTKLEASTFIQDYPALIAKRIPKTNIGYLLYNHFTPGNETEANVYNNIYNEDLVNKMQQLSGVTDLILDLRYNGGGFVTCAELLMSLIIPNTEYDKPVGYMKYNTNQQSSNKDILASPKTSNIKTDLNLNIKNLYVIVSQLTASASELMINSLYPYMNVHVIGETTVGKNVGSIGFNKFGWHMQPIVTRVYNALNQSEYYDGFEPGEYNHQGVVKPHGNYPISEYVEYLNNNKFGELGEIDEPLLSRTLEIIYGNTNSVSTRSIDNNFVKVRKGSALHTRSNDLIITQ